MGRQRERTICDAARTVGARQELSINSSNNYSISSLKSSNPAAGIISSFLLFTTWFDRIQLLAKYKKYKVDKVDILLPRGNDKKIHEIPGIPHVAALNSRPK